VRALEFLLADAERRGHRRLITTGGTGSNWLLCVAFYASRIGATLDALVFAQPDGERVRETQRALVALGVRQRRAPLPLLPLLAVGPLLRGARPLPPGGSSTLGALGHVVAGLELCEQVRAGLLPDPRQVYVALGSCGTAAGLALGMGLGGSGARLVAVRVADRLVANQAHVVRLARAAARPLDVPARLAPVEIVHRQFGGRYGRATGAAEAAVRRAAEAGLRLDTTYTGKALAELLQRAPTGPVLFWNTFDGRALDSSPLTQRPPPTDCP
jgi:1-aminocyclopropane-1-carboxylate deaminase/D-cysteine desulfhydrase-like pyridoxal-dependent ACC family enzyme